MSITWKKELPGLSLNSGHRPGDAVTGPMADGGGTTRLVIDTTVTYLSASTFNTAVYNDRPDAALLRAEQLKRNAIDRDVANGVRTPLQPGFEFVPAAMDTRGQCGPGMAKLLERIADHGAGHAHAASGEGGKAKAKFLGRFRARLATALHRALMEGYLYRAQKVAEAAEARTGMAAVSALELRFQR